MIGTASAAMPTAPGMTSTAVPRSAHGPAPLTYPECSAAGLDDVLAGSLDVYPRLRSLYLQKRASELGEAVGVTVTPQTEMVDAPPAPAEKPKRPAAKIAQKPTKTQ